MTATLLPTDPTTPAPHPGAADTTARTAALVAGIGYAVLFVLAIVANFGIRLQLVVPDDAAATVDNLVAHEGAFRWGMAAFTVVFLVDVAVAWGLHVLLSPTGRHRSLLAAWFRITYTVFLGVAVVFLALALALATGDGALDRLAGDQAEALTMAALHGFDVTWLIGLAAFGIHLILVGAILIRSGLARNLGRILAVAGAAYVADTLAHLVLTDYAAVEDLFLALVAIPSVVAEAAFTVWLLRRARAERAPRPATA